MDQNRKKYIAREFLERLASADKSGQSLKPPVMDLAHAPEDVRMDVARGLLAIGADRFESIFRRKYALNILATIARVCALTNDEEIQEQLIRIIDAPVDETEGIGSRAKTRPLYLAKRRLQKSALLALVAVNGTFALQKVNQLLAQNEDPEFAQDLLGIRNLITDRGN